jgi:hypothetical protein
MQNPADHYVPALSHDWLTPLYDPVIRRRPSSRSAHLTAPSNTIPVLRTRGTVKTNAF